MDRARHPYRLVGRAEMHVAADLGGNVTAQAAETTDVVTLGGFGQFPPDMRLPLALRRDPTAFNHHGGRAKVTFKMARLAAI